MRAASIRFRITAIAVVVVVVVLTLAAFGVVIAQRRQLTSALDSTLGQRADDIAALVGAGSSMPIEFGASEQEGFAQLADGSGRVVAASPNLAGMPALDVGYTLGEAEAIRTIDDVPVDDDAFRVLSRTVATAAGDSVLHIGTTYDIVGESSEAVTTSLAIAIPIVALLMSALVWWLVGRTLQPVEELTAELAAIGAGGLHRRVAQPANRDEIGQLAATMNQMLERLEDSVGRQQRFAADASHELRSPLTRMRSELEVDLLDAAEPARRRLESIRDEVIELQHLVEDLLVLARSDADEMPAGTEPVDLDDLVIKEVERLRAEGDVVVDMGAVSAAQVPGHQGQLTRAIRNLGDNARRHAKRQITFTLREVGDAAILTVEDDGPGISADQAEMIFERFGRTDSSRSRNSGGSGLGLSITREIVHRHGGTIEVDISHRPGARFVMRLPLR